WLLCPSRLGRRQSAALYFRAIRVRRLQRGDLDRADRTGRRLLLWPRGRCFFGPAPCLLRLALLPFALFGSPARPLRLPFEAHTLGLLGAAGSFGRLAFGSTRSEIAHFTAQTLTFEQHGLHMFDARLLQLQGALGEKPGKRVRIEHGPALSQRSAQGEADHRLGA